MGRKEKPDMSSATLPPALALRPCAFLDWATRAIGMPVPPRVDAITMSCKPADNSAEMRSAIDTCGKGCMYSEI